MFSTAKSFWPAAAASEPACWGSDFCIAGWHGYFRKWTCMSMRRHSSSRIGLVVSQHSHWCCIAQQIFTKSSFQLCKWVSLLRLYRLGWGQDESNRRTWLLLHSCSLIFFGLLIFCMPCSFSLRKNNQRKGTYKNVNS